MKGTATLIFLLVMGSFTFQSDFLSDQKKYARVRTAIREKETAMARALGHHGLSLDNINLLLVAYKDNDLLEVYVGKKGGAVYEKLRSYQICSRSGQLGPKRKEGDYQVPEGFYHIDRFNPASNFYLSLGLNYPNAADRKKSSSPRLGGDIFIHGSCVTIGCLPMTDDHIKEIYLYAVHAKNNGQRKIPVYIFPFKMTDQEFLRYSAMYAENAELVAFWSNLKEGYDRFVKNTTELQYQVREDGNYTFGSASP